LITRRCRIFQEHEEDQCPKVEEILPEFLAPSSSIETHGKPDGWMMKLAA
jgi:hypothetical protein